MSNSFESLISEWFSNSNLIDLWSKLLIWNKFGCVFKLVKWQLNFKDSLNSIETAQSTLFLFIFSLLLFRRPQVLSRKNTQPRLDGFLLGKLCMPTKSNYYWHLKMFLKPVWEGKMHGVTKIGVFRPLFCVGMLGKSTNYSTGTRPLCSTFWAK